MLPLGKQKRDRRRLGRPRNPNKAPTDTSVRMRKSTIDKLDQAIPYHRMPIDEKIDHLIKEVLSLRKKVGSQPYRIDQPIERYPTQLEWITGFQESNTKVETKYFAKDPAEDGIIIEHD